MLTRYIGATAPLVAVFLATPAFSADICVALLAQGIRDTSSQQVSEARFNELKANVCNSSYDSYSKSASQAMSGGFDVPGMFGISASSANASAEYSTKWTNFCQADYGLSISNSEMKTYFSTANRAVLNSFDNCVNVTSERFVRYVEPQADGRIFSITFNNKGQGNSTFRVLGISLTNSTASQVMNVLQSCDVPPPFNKPFPWDTGIASMNTNSFSIVCRKNPNDTIIVAGTTSAGNIDPVVVQAVPNAGPTIVDRVAGLEANLRQAVPAGTVVAYSGERLPAGWLWCNGDTKSRSVFAELFRATGEVYGRGDGSTTFQLPDYRGRFLRGIDQDGAGGVSKNDPDRSGGVAAIGTVQPDQFQDHVHEFNRGADPTGDEIFTAGRSRNTGTPRGQTNFIISGNHGSETRPKNVAVGWIIKY